MANANPAWLFNHFLGHLLLPGLVLFGLLFQPVQAQEPIESEPRPKIGLVLPGGGAHGLAHIGVIKELERLNIPIDYISGTSMGALVGGLYASGLSSEEIENFVSHVDWDQTFTDDHSRHYLSFRRKQDQFHFFLKGELGYGNGRFRLPTGLVLGQQQALMLKGMTLPSSDIHRFDDLPTPFRAVATDAVSGEEVVLKQGDLSAALRASMSVPGIFAPVEIDGRKLVDGGVTNNTPIDVVRDMGADIVIVSDTHTPTPKDEQSSYLEITGNIISSMITANSIKQLNTLTPQDVLIRVRLPDTIKATDFERFANIIHIGEEAAIAEQDKLSTLSLPGYHRQTPKRSWPVIDRIEFDNHTEISEHVLRSYIRQQEGKEIDRTQLETDITYLYGLGFFELITYQIEHQGDDTILRIYTQAPTWGPNFFKVKFSLASNLSDDSVFNLGLRHTYMPINSMGAEWRNEFGIGEHQLLKTSYYQPLNDRQNYYAKGSLNFTEGTYLLSNDEFGINSVQLEQRQMYPELEIGVNIGLNWRAFTRYRLENGTILIGKNKSSQIENKYEDHIVSLGIQHDSLDQVAFPHHGTLMDLALHNTIDERTGLGDTVEYKGLFSTYHTFGRHTINLHLNATDMHIDEASDIHRFYTLGGFQRLSGYSENDLLGNKILFAKIKYLYLISASRNPMNFPFYVGGTLEAGNVYDDGAFTGVDNNEFSWRNTKQAGSIFVGMNSFLGPVYFAYGYHNEDYQSLYFYFGHAFN